MTVTRLPKSSRKWLTTLTLFLNVAPLSAEFSWDEEGNYTNPYSNAESYSNTDSDTDPIDPSYAPYTDNSAVEIDSSLSSDPESESDSTDFSGNLDDEQRLVGCIDITFADRKETSAVLKQKVLARMKTIEGRYFSQLDFDQDLKALVRDYDHVEPTIRREGNRIHLSLSIWPKPTIRSICWVGNQKFPTKLLQGQLDINAKSRFERTDFHKAFQKVKTFYIKKGFFESELNYSVGFHEEANEVTINIEIKEGRSGKIEQILLSGLTKQERKDITPNMITKRYRAFVSWITGDGIYDQDAVKMDEFHILEFLHNKGYADAKVDVDVRESCFENRIEVDITAEKGTQYRIGAIEIIDIEKESILSEEQRKRCLTVHTNGVYSPETIRGTISRLQNAYGRLGYIDALVDLDTKLNSETCTYDLRFTVSPGQCYRIGLVRVVGNICTQTRVILHENLMTPGELFNLDMLRITEARLFNIGYFKNVNIYPTESEEVGEDGCPVRDVVIEVEETGTGNFSAFGGFSTTEGLFTGITITESNFDHAGLACAHKKGLRALRGGGEFLSLTTNLGTKSNGVQLSWTQPHFRDTPWSIGFDIDRSNDNTITENYTIESTGGSVHATYPLTSFLRVSNHYRLQYSHLALSKQLKKFNKEQRALNREQRALEAAIGAPKEKECEIDKETGKEKKKDHPHCITSNEQLGKRDGLISAIGCGWIYDSTDSPVCPTQGSRNRIDIEYAGIGGHYHFYSVAWINTYYQPISERGTLKLRADLNFIKPLGNTKAQDIPVDERLFLGGDTGVRGYRPYAIGPKLDGNPVGGLSMQLLSAEYNYRFPVFDGFLFYDAGALSADVWHFDRLRSAAGLGIRFQVLQQAPPVTMGVGFPINPRCPKDVKRFFWSMGGRF